MPSRFYVIPVAEDGSLPHDLAICMSKSAAFETAIRHAKRYPGLVIAEEANPETDLQLIKVVGTVDPDVLDQLVA